MAVELRSRKSPITPRKRYRWTIEWKANSLTAGQKLIAKIEWLDILATTIVRTDTLFNKEVTKADTFQIDSGMVGAPPTARFARFSLSRGTDATYKIFVDRCQLDEQQTSLERRTRGIVLFDDFLTFDTIEGTQWGRTDIGGASATFDRISAVAASHDNWSESGVVELSTSTNGDGANIHLNDGFYAVPPAGTEFRVKARVTGTTTGMGFWAGLSSSKTLYPDVPVGNNLEFLGITARSDLGSNWHGIVRKGTTNESTVDLGVKYDTVWRDLGWRVTHTGMQFTVNGVDVGTEVTTYAPTGVLRPLFGFIQGAAGGTRSIEIDYYGLETILNRNA